MASKSYDTTTILKALDTLQLLVATQWKASEEVHQAYVDSLSQHGSKLATFADLKGFASFQTDEINQFLVENGQPGDFPELDFGQIGVTSVFDLLMNWQVIGNKSFLLAEDDNEYPGFTLPGDQVEVFENHLSGDHVLKISTSIPGTKLVICTSKSNVFGHLSGLDLVKMAQSIMSTPLLSSAEEFEEVLLPMIDYQGRYDLQDIIGLQIGLGWITKAEQRMLFRMNEKGARMMARTDANASFGFASSFAVTAPFLAYVDRGAGVPFGVVYCDFDSWKEPAEL